MEDTIILNKIESSENNDERVLLISLLESENKKANAISQYITDDNINYFEKNTIEFRLSEGTLDFEEIKNNIRLYGRLFQTLCGKKLPKETRANLLIDFLFEENERDLKY